MMMPRAQLILVLIGIEVAILGMMVLAVDPAPFTPTFPKAPSFSTIWSPSQTAASGPNLVEGGPQASFDAGAHPVLNVDIGYADLTILTHPGPTLDVSVSKSDAFGPFRTTAPITARKASDSLRIATAQDQQGWSMGDDRMVTVIVPPQTQVNVVNAGDIHVSGLRASATINSTGNGFITIDDYDAPSLHVAADNGPITLHQVAANVLEATSRNDRITGTGLKIRDGHVQADDSISLGFIAGLDATVSADASDGSVHINGFPNAPSSARANADGDSAIQTVRMGNGSGHIDVHSDSGNVNLNQDN
jgi:hypothetical protein